MFKHLWLILLLIAIVGLAYFGYPIIKTRYFDNAGKTIRIQSVPDNSMNQKEQAVDNSTKTEDQDVTVVIPIEKKTDEPSLKEITSADCDSECSSFEKDEKYLKYCQEVCGLNPTEPPASGCETVSGIEKDYCLKDLAISQKNFKTCDEIQDGNIKLTCQNRITQDIIEGQQSL